MPLVATAAVMHLRPGGLSTVEDAMEPVEWVEYYAEVTQPQLRSGGSQLSTDNWLFCCWFGKLWSRCPNELLNELGLWVIKSRELSLEPYWIRYMKRNPPSCFHFHKWGVWTKGYPIVRLVEENDEAENQAWETHSIALSRQGQNYPRRWCSWEF